MLTEHPDIQLVQEPDLVLCCQIKLRLASPCFPWELRPAVLILRARRQALLLCQSASRNILHIASVPLHIFRCYLVLEGCILRAQEEN